MPTLLPHNLGCTTGLTKGIFLKGEAILKCFSLWIENVTKKNPSQPENAPEFPVLQSNKISLSFLETSNKASHVHPPPSHQG